MTTRFKSINEVKRHYFPNASRDPKETGDCKRCIDLRNARDRLEAKFPFIEKHDDAGECGECMATRCMDRIRNTLLPKRDFDPPV